MSYESYQQLLYPLGYLAQIMFTLRFVVQWIYSEKYQESHTPIIFWLISLFGNYILWSHCCIQMQYPIALIQSANALISVRHLQISYGKASSITFSKALSLLIIPIIGTTLIFLFIGYIFNQTSWLQVPQGSFITPPNKVSLFMHIFGTCFYLIFNSRLWIQWYQAEKHFNPSLTPLFWKLSLIGAFGSCIYFYLIADPVNLIGPALGSFIYARNLLLISKKI